MTAPLWSVFCPKYAAISLGKIICMAAYILLDVLHFGYISLQKFCFIYIRVIAYLIWLHMPLFLRLPLVRNSSLPSKCFSSQHILKYLLEGTNKQRKNCHCSCTEARSFWKSSVWQFYSYPSFHSSCYYRQQSKDPLYKWNKKSRKFTATPGVCFT